MTRKNWHIAIALLVIGAGILYFRRHHYARTFSNLPHLPVSPNPKPFASANIPVQKGTSPSSNLPPNQLQSQNLQRTLKTIQEINQINKLNQEQRQRTSTSSNKPK